MTRTSGYSGHLLIDGYNIIYQWPFLRDVLENYGVQAARAQLGEWVRIIHDMDNYRVTLVFDGRGPQPEIERPERELTFSYLFTPGGMTADQIIEQLVCTSKKPIDMIVATRDNLLTETVGANGGRIITPDGLLEWVQRCRLRAARLIAEHNQSVQKRWRCARRADIKPRTRH